MSSFLKKNKKNKRILAYPYFLFEILRFNNGLKKKFKRKVEFCNVCQNSKLM
jgi:hypothetical protein